MLGMTTSNAPVVMVFLLANAAFVYYLVSVLPTLREYAPGMVATIGWSIFTLGVFQVGMHITGSAAPTGKFNTGAIALSAALPVNIAWCTMEQPAFVVPAVALAGYVRAGGTFHPGVVFLGMFMTHYFQRAYIYPWLSRGRPYPIHAWFFAMLFCISNGTMQSNELLYGPQQPISVLYSPRFLLGACVFVFGMAANIQADHILRNLRKPGETAYKIPTGGLFDYVSGAHFVGEVIEWSGYAIAAASFAPLIFAAFNWMGIGTRAVATHTWNLEKFGAEYPAGRKRLIPLVW